MRPMSDRIAVELDRLSRDEVTFETFVSRTRNDWETLATSLLNRWTAPIEVEDLRQAMLECAWQLLPKWNPSLGPLHRFVVWNAVNEAKRQIHKARGANIHGSADKSSTRYHLIELTGASREKTVAYQDWIDLSVSEDPIQDRVAEARERVEQLKTKCRTERDLRMLEALIEEGSLDAAAVVIYAEGLSTGSIDSARLSVQRMAKRLTRKD
jgi:hypothetical protein